MSTNTKIQWTDATINPIIGCTKISPACDHCYAEVMANRLSYIKNTVRYINVVNANGKWNGSTNLINSELLKPYHWKKPKNIFICSMSDMFHESVPFTWIDAIFNMMSDCDWHIFQILTKRPQRVLDYLDYKNKQLEIVPWYIPSNIWFGVTVENQDQANKRIPILLKIPADCRFISCEPLLGEIDLESIQQFNGDGVHIASYQVLTPIYNSGDSNRPALDQVIVGPETGTKKRPMKKEWIENIYNSCKKYDVSFFDKKNTLGLDKREIPVHKIINRSTYTFTLGKKRFEHTPGKKVKRLKNLY